jgi:hypothetical protein
MHSVGTRGQNELVAFGADGAYPSMEQPPEAVALTVQNLAGNKLDYYLETELDLKGRRDAEVFGEVDATVTLRNTAPAGATQPQYVFGPGPTETPLPAGVERALVTMYLPPGTSVAGVGGDRPLEPVASGTEAGRPYAAFTLDVPAGQARTVTLSLRLAPRPEGPYWLDVVPSPRVLPTRVRVQIAADAGLLEGDVELDRHWRFGDGSGPTAVLAPAFR